MFYLQGGRNNRTKDLELEISLVSGIKVLKQTPTGRRENKNRK